MMNVPLQNKQIYQLEEAEVGLVEMILPPQTVPLFLILIVILPLALLTAESLFVPLLEWMNSASTGAEEGLPFHFFIKMGAFLLLSFFGVFQLLMRINTTYYAVWARSFSRPHPLHVDYQPDEQQSILALLNWNMYRLMMICAPPIGLTLLTGLVGVIEIYLFNVLSGMPLISLPIQFIIALFIIMVLVLVTAFAYLNSVWTAFTTIYGDVAAVTEPDLPAKTIYERCGRIAFMSPLSYLLYPTYFFFWIALLAEVYLLITTLDIQDLIHFRANLPLIVGLEVATIGLYLLMNYLRFYTYHTALVNYYAKLPSQLKERFNPPPATRNAGY